jgi:putative SOS response-associated peptidase YedK
MEAKAFDSDASLDERRVIIRRSGGDVEMVEMPWGLQPREVGGRPFTVIRAEGRVFPSHRCLVPAADFRFRSRGRHYSFALDDGDWFYFAGIWRSALQDWPEAYAILTIKANDDVAPYHDRQMAVLRREQRMAWLDMTCPEDALLRALPAGSFTVSPLHEQDAQAVFAF